MNRDLQQLGFNNERDLFKALSTNNFGQLDTKNQRGGAALIPESLEATLRTLTFNEEHCKLWKNINKDKAFSTVEEYSTVDSYGEDISAFQAEGIAGADTTSNYQRNFRKVKNINTTRSVTDLMKLVNAVEDPEVLETQNGMRWVMKQAEVALFYGDSTLKASQDPEGLEWDGLFKQIDKANTLDLKGEYLTDKVLNDAGNTILDNYGIATKAYMPTQVSRIFSEQYYPDQRALMNVQAGNITAGTLVTKFNSVGGNIEIEPDVFMRRGLQALNTNQTAVGLTPPTSPTVVAEASTEDSVNAFEAGTYRYAVVAVNSSGNSAPVVSDPVAVSDDKKGVKLTITNATTQMYAPDFFVIYRTEKDGANFYEIARIGVNSRDASAVTEFIDTNETLPNTGQAIIGDFSNMNVSFKQLAPMFKLDYAIVGPAKRFGIFLYGTPIVYAPKKFVTIKNIKIK